MSENIKSPYREVGVSAFAYQRKKKEKPIPHVTASPRELAAMRKADPKVRCQHVKANGRRCRNKVPKYGIDWLCVVHWVVGLKRRRSTSRYRWTKAA